MLFLLSLLGIVSMVYGNTDFKSDVQYNATYIKQDIIPHVSHLFTALRTDMISHTTNAEKYKLQPIRAREALLSQRKTPLFSWMDTRYALSIIRLNYCSISQIKTFMCPDCEDMKLKLVYKSDTTDKGQVIIVTTEAFMLVGFHGSSKPIATWLSDVHTKQIKFPCIRCKVNHDFYHQFLEMVDKTIDALTELHEQEPLLPIYISGHSSGAALSTLLAVYISIHYPSLPVTHVFTFGSPRVGNTEFATFANKIIGERWFRVMNQLDIVPSIPSQSFGYHHVGQLVLCNTGTTICIIKGRNEENEGGAIEDLVRVKESSSDSRLTHFTYLQESIRCTIK